MWRTYFVGCNSYTHMHVTEVWNSGGTFTYRVIDFE